MSELIKQAIRQAKHNAKRRSEGAAVIAIQFRADEPEAQV
jgi:hypothetical protein